MNEFFIFLSIAIVLLMLGTILYVGFYLIQKGLNYLDKKKLEKNAARGEDPEAIEDATMDAFEDAKEANENIDEKK